MSSGVAEQVKLTSGGSVTTSSDEATLVSSPALPPRQPRVLAALLSLLNFIRVSLLLKYFYCVVTVRDSIFCDYGGLCVQVLALLRMLVILN